jgi:hypothetical protein
MSGGDGDENDPAVTVMCPAVTVMRRAVTVMGPAVTAMKGQCGSVKIIEAFQPAGFTIDLAG